MLRRIALSRFRNFESANLLTGARDVFFVGENGQGKTNLLEAAYFLSYASSFRSSTDGEAVMHGQEEAEIEGEYSISAENIGERIKIRLGRERKSVQIDGKTIQDRRDLVQAHPCVVFGHEDLDFAVGGPERRRFFFDQTATLVFPLYLDFFRDYKRTLKLRNACLRDGRRDLIEIMDEQLVKHGMDLMASRRRAVDAFSSMFTDVYEEVSRLPYRVEIFYQPSWEGEEDAKRSLRAGLISDLERGLTSTGPHRDKFIFKALDGNFAKSASTGQLRLLSLVLRSCQARYYREKSGEKPILLMDDVLLELDPEKRKRFMKTLPEREQTFSTFLPGEPYESYKGEDTIVYAIEGGKASLIEGDPRNG
jgi:DNA replication and repair protein RecF